MKILFCWKGTNTHCISEFSVYTYLLLFKIKKVQCTSKSIQYDIIHVFILFFNFTCTYCSLDKFKRPNESMIEKSSSCYYYLFAITFSFGIPSHAVY